MDIEEGQQIAGSFQLRKVTNGHTWTINVPALGSDDHRETVEGQLRDAIALARRLDEELAEAYPEREPAPTPTRTLTRKTPERRTRS